MSARHWLVLLAAATTVAGSARAEPRNAAQTVCASGDVVCARERLANVTCFFDLASRGPGPKLCVHPGPTRLGSRWGASLELKF